MLVMHNGFLSYVQHIYSWVQLSKKTVNGRTVVNPNKTPKDYSGETLLISVQCSFLLMLIYKFIDVWN
jgi:hypothetical protein